MEVPGTVAIVGASADRSRFANKALRAYHELGASVFPVRPGIGSIEGLRVFSSVRDLPVVVDLVLFYVRPEIGVQVLEDVHAKGIRRIFLNPGTTSPQLEARARELGLDVLSGCAILAVGKSPADY